VLRTLLRMQPSRTLALGQWGEDLAAQHLTSLGMQVLARNWRCDVGELDLVVRDVDGTVVFVEVKTRAGTGFGEPAEAVGRVKARKLRELACRWLLEHRPPGSAELRFDVVGIVRRRDKPPEVTHLRAAF
jgi:putative endonuclease